MKVTELAEQCGRLIAEIEKVIVGKRKVVEQVVVGLLAGGHVLIEDIPGVGKTMLARSLALSLGGSFKRIQFTPDLLPADITGTSIFNQKTNQFEFRPGPIFGNIVLADEINRATPKAQSSLLEAMEEGTISYDGVVYELPRPFLVIATDNPIEYEGVYSLPEAQLDRFLMKIHIGYPSARDEVTILTRQMRQHPIDTVRPVLSDTDVLELQSAVREIYVDESLKRYMVNIIAATRRDEQVLLGASPRGSIGLMHASQALAGLRGREFVLPDDVKELARNVLEHRIIVKPELRMRGVTADAVVERALKAVPVPVTEELG